jgi:CBS domain-containing protein
MADLSKIEKAQRLRIYIGESDRWRGRPLYSELLNALRGQGLAGATVVRGVAGFGAHSHLHAASILRLSEDLPLIIDVIDQPEKIKAALDVVYPMVREGLITLEDVTVVKYTHRYLNPLPADRPVSQAMTRDVAVLPPETPIYAAWQRMLESHIKAIPIVDARRRVVGILTDEDLLERAGIRQRLAVAARLDAEMVQEEIKKLQGSDLKVSDVMSHPVVTVKEDEPLGVATQRMVKAGLKRLPVVDASDQIAGILSRLDILSQVADIPSPTSPAHFAATAARTVGDVMLPDIPTAAQNDDLSTLVDKFLAGNTHRLVVIDDQNKAIGLLSDSDVIARIHPSRQRGMLEAFRQVGKPPLGKETAFDLMSPGVLAVHPDLSIVEAAKKMLSAGRKWLVVIDREEHPIGLVDRQTLLEALTSVYKE